MSNCQTHHRRSIRLKEWDYAEPGAYFVTICTYRRVHLFGRVVDGVMELNEFGEIVRACWDELPTHFPRVELDAFVVLPNHIHGIIVIIADDIVGATHASPLHPRGPAPHSLGAIVGSFKSAVTRRINVLRETPGARVWQRNYWEHIIRNAVRANGRSPLHAIRRYIVYNPARWAWDRYNPDAVGPDPWARDIWRMMKADARSRPRGREPAPTDPIPTPANHRDDEEAHP